MAPTIGDGARARQRVLPGLPWSQCAERAARRHIEQHTHHAAGSAGSVCIACHMPQIAQTLADVNVRSHTFHFVTPSADRDAENSERLQRLSCRQDDRLGQCGAQKLERPLTLALPVVQRLLGGTESTFTLLGAHMIRYGSVSLDRPFANPPVDGSRRRPWWVFVPSDGRFPPQPIDRSTEPMQPSPILAKLRSNFSPLAPYMRGQQKR